MKEGKETVKVKCGPQGQPGGEGAERPQDPKAAPGKGVPPGAFQEEKRQKAYRAQDARQVPDPFRQRDQPPAVRHVVQLVIMEQGADQPLPGGQDVLKGVLFPPQKGGDMPPHFRIQIRRKPGGFRRGETGNLPGHDRPAFRQKADDGQDAEEQQGGRGDAADKGGSFPSGRGGNRLIHYCIFR